MADADLYTAEGHLLIRKGKVAVVILAGGQGSRLGFEHPKGMFDIGLPSGKSIFQILTERFLRIMMDAHETEELTKDVQTCKMMIMTSSINHEETQMFFKDNNFFGGNENSFVFFQQASLPAVDKEGKIIMKSPSEIQMSPNGNGALFEAINSNEIVKQNIQSTQYVQVIGVDNVLNKILDPLLIGFTSSRGLQASLKCCKKAFPEEKVGTLCIKNGKYDIIEYSEMTEAQTNRKVEGTDSLYFELGNLLIHMFNSEKLLNLCASTETLNKLYHFAFKKIEHWDQTECKSVKP